MKRAVVPLIDEVTGREVGFTWTIATQRSAALVATRSPLAGQLFEQVLKTDPTHWKPCTVVLIDVLALDRAQNNGPFSQFLPEEVVTSRSLMLNIRNDVPCGLEVAYAAVSMFLKG